MMSPFPSLVRPLLVIDLLAPVVLLHGRRLFFESSL